MLFKRLKTAYNQIGLVLIVLIMSEVFRAKVDAMTLAQNGKTDYVIVIAQDASDSEKTAARELRDYLGKVTGATFFIRTEAVVKPEAPQILVGPSRRFKKLLPNIKWAALKQDGIVIKTRGKHLLLAGGRPRGTLYAVYTFLEDVVGCRWWTSTESYLPRRPVLQVAGLDITYTPKLRYREAFYRDVNRNPLFAAKLKVNGHFSLIPPEYGGHYTILGWCHTFYQLLPPEKYFAQHPEWYSEIEGRRVADGAQLCLTNEEMRKELMRVALEWIRKQPDAGMISIAQNDWGGRCQCVDCKALEEKEGSPSGPLIHFVNAVAADIEKEHPQFLIETLAYQYTRKPPLHVRPRRNVVVRLCSIECDFARPLEGDANKDFRDDIRSWSAIAPNLYIWDYVTNFANYILPHPNMTVLASNVRFFVRHNAIGVFEQGDAGCGVGDFVRLRAWLLSHLLWDPSRDEKKLAQEFLQGYYGPAAPHLAAYLDLVQEAISRKGVRLSCFNQDISFLTLEDLTEATRLFSEAEKAVAGNPTLALRVRRERLPLDHVWLLRYDFLKRSAAVKGLPFPGPQDPVAACDAFIKTARELDVGNYNEGQAFATYEPALKARFRPPAPPPEECRDLPKEGWADIQDNLFHLFNGGAWASIVDDPKASDGKAARMPGSHTRWAVQLPVSGDLLDIGSSPWHCYIVIRCEAKAKTGTAFTAGIYDNDSKRNIAGITESLEQAGDGLYRTYDLGVHLLKPGMYFWVAPPGNEAVEAVYVDRIFLIGKKGDERP